MNIESKCVRDFSQNKIHDCYQGNTPKEINGMENFLGKKIKFNMCGSVVV